MVNSCLTVEYPPVHRRFVVVDASLLGCGSRSVYVFDTRWNGIVFGWIVIALVDFVLSQQGEIKVYLFQCV